MPKPLPKIVKSTGEEAFFSEKKLMSSLLRSGAEPAVAAGIVKQVKINLRSGMTTREIYRLAFSLLRSGARHVAARYNLKQSIIALGPEGFFFEKYIAAVLRSQGYSPKNSVIMNGNCVSHEVDVLARKNDELHIIECKFHHHDGLNCDVKVPLYIHSRFNDIRTYESANGDRSIKKYVGWVVTNTRFTQDAVRYGVCSGLRLLSWNYPEREGLRDLVDKHRLYPLTCLTSLSKNEKTMLLEKGFILASELTNDAKSLKKTGMSAQKIGVVLAEIRNLCSAVVDAE